MTEFKTIQKASDSITITIPPELQGKQIEVIIREVDPLLEKRKKLQDLLLQGPVWSEEQYQAYLESREHLEKWNQI